MEEQNENNAKEEDNNDLNDQHEKIYKQELLTTDAAGPSRFIPLPGEIIDGPKNVFQPRTGISKSEHSLRQIITSQDVANALKLTSLSFTPANETIKSIKSIDCKELNIPILNISNTNEHCTPATFLDLKMLVASCFNPSKDVENFGISRVPHVQNVHTAISSIITEPTQDITNPNGFQHHHSEIEDVINISNEIKAANPNFIVTKLSKMIEENKKNKTSGNLSEKSDLARDSLSSIGSNVCRICMIKGRERLISPCDCKGSLANVHLSCLERWLNHVGRNHCELCGFSYPARYTVLQALRLWFGNPRSTSHLQSDCLIFWLLSTVTAGLLAVCIVGTQYFVIEGNKFGKLDAGTRKDEVNFIGLFGATYSQAFPIVSQRRPWISLWPFCGYSITVYLLWKDHYVMWNRWRRANVNVRLLLAPDSNEPRAVRAST